MNDDFVPIGVTCISKPPGEPVPDEEGRFVLLTHLRVNPLDVSEWGFDSEGFPYARILFDDDSDREKRITMEELLRTIDETASDLRKHGYTDFAEGYAALKRRICADRPAEPSGNS